jgi:hypothetical protein
VTKCGFYLSAHVGAVVINFENCLCGVGNAPNNNSRNLDWVTASIVHLDGVANFGSRTQ